MWYRHANQQQELDLGLPPKEPELSEEEKEWQRIEAWQDQADSVAENALHAFLQNPKSKQDWPLVSASRLIKIWNDFAVKGIIRDTKGLQEIADTMVHNTMLLDFNTQMSGHTTQDPRHIVEEYAPDAEWTDELDELHADHIEDERGQWRISDYALQPLLADAYELKSTFDPVKQLYIIDRMLDRVHARSDIAALYVEGGSKTLTQLFELR